MKQQESNISWNPFIRKYLEVNRKEFLNQVSLSSRGHSSPCLRKSGAQSLFLAPSSQEEHTPGCWKLQISLAVFLQHPTLGFSATYVTAPFAANQAVAFKGKTKHHMFVKVTMYCSVVAFSEHWSRKEGERMCRHLEYGICACYRYYLLLYV